LAKENGFMTEKLEIRNMVVSVDFSDKIDLDKVASELESTEYSPEQFPGLIFRVKDPKSAVLIFSSGRMNCTGTTSMEDTKKVIKIVLKKMKGLGFKIKKPRITVQNIVATASLGKRMDLDKILELENSEYEPEQFPGLVLRMKNPKVSFLIFTTGKVVITGARDEKMMNEAFKKLKQQLKKVGGLKS